VIRAIATIALGVFLVTVDMKAASAGGVAGYALPQSDAPVQVTSCAAGVQFVSNGWGTSFSRLNTSVDFVNHATKAAVAVLFRLQLSSVFGTILDNRFASATGEFSPEASIKGNHWSDTDSWPGLGIVQCSISRVQFADGSTWIEPRAVASPSPAPSPANVATPA